MSEEGKRTRADRVHKGQVFLHEGKRYDAFAVKRYPTTTHISVNESGTLIVKLQNWVSVTVIGEW